MAQMLTAKQVAEVKGCSPRYIKKIIQDGKLKAVETVNSKNRKTYLVPLDALDEELQHKYHCGELQRELEWLTISREQFFDSKNQLESRGLTDIQRAARFFHIIKVSFGSDRRTFGTNKKNLANAIEYLPLIQKRLQDVVIENKDFENLIRVYDRPGALFYLDPPYHGTEKYYEGSFTEADHERLKAVLSSIKGRFILSYNDDAYVRELYKGYNIEEISRNNSLAGKTKTSQFKELIIRNYEK